MRSFSILSAVAAVAFSLFASAAPAPIGEGLVPAIPGLGAVTGTGTGKGGLGVRGELKSVPVILTELYTNLQPTVVKIYAFKKETATTENITPVLTEIVTCVGTAVDGLKLLVGAPVAIILASVEGTVALTVKEVAILLVRVLNLVLTALCGLVALVAYDLALLGPTLAVVGAILATLVVCVLRVVDGLLIELGPLVGGLVPLLKVLAFHTLCGALKLSY